MTNIVWKKPDGTVAVTHCNEHGFGTLANVKVKRKVQYWRDKEVMEPQEVEEISINPKTKKKIAVRKTIKVKKIHNVLTDEFEEGTEVQWVAQTPEEHAAMLQERGDIPEDWEMVATEIELPETREWRGAWTWTTKKPEVDICINRAKDVTKERLRWERKPLLEGLDLDTVRAIESGDEQAIKKIADKKQKLRDITLLPEKAKTLDDLRKIKAE